MSLLAVHNQEELYYHTKQLAQRLIQHKLMPGTWAEELALRCPYPVGTKWDYPVECWVIDSVPSTRTPGRYDDLPVRVWVHCFHGHCDNWNSSWDYVDTQDGRHFSSFYLFPVNYYKKPEIAFCEDQHGKFRQWVAYRKTPMRVRRM